MDKKAKLFTKRIAERLANEGLACVKAKSVLQRSIKNISRDSLKKELGANFGLYVDYLRKCMKRLQVKTSDSSTDKNIQLVQTWEDCRHLSQLDDQDNRHLCTHVLIKELESDRTDFGQILQQYEERCHSGGDSTHVAWMASTKHLLSATRNPSVITKLMLYYLSKVQDVAEEDMVANKDVKSTLEHLKHFLSMSYMRSDEVEPENTDGQQKRKDVLSSLLSIFVDLLVYTNRNNEKKKVAKELTSYTSYLLDGNWETTLEVLLQVSSPVESHHLLPFVRSCLVRAPTAMTDHAVYLKLMLCLRKFHEVVPDIVEKNLSVRAPLGFIDWLTERSSEVISEIPDDTKFKGRQITLFLLKNASDELQLLLEDVLTDREAVCDLEVGGQPTEVEVTEVKATEAPVFVVDRTGQEKHGKETLKMEKKKKERTKKQKKNKAQKGVEPRDATVEGSTGGDMEVKVIDLPSVLDAMMESESSQPGPAMTVVSESEAEGESEADSYESIQEDVSPKKQKQSSKKTTPQKGAEPDVDHNMEVEVIDLSSVLDVMLKSESGPSGPAMECISESEAEADSELEGEPDSEAEVKADSDLEAQEDSESEYSSESVQEVVIPKKVGKESKIHSDSEINKSPKKVQKEDGEFHLEKENSKSPKKMIKEDGEFHLDRKNSKSPKQMIKEDGEFHLEKENSKSPKQMIKEDGEFHLDREKSKSPKQIGKEDCEFHLDREKSKSPKKVGEIHLDTKISKSPKKVGKDLDKSNFRDHKILSSLKKIGKEVCDIQLDTEVTKSPKNIGKEFVKVQIGTKSPKKVSKHFEEVVLDTSPSEDDNDNNVSVPNLAQYLLNENQVVPTMYIAAEDNKVHTKSVVVGDGQKLMKTSSSGGDSPVEIVDTSDSVEEIDANGNNLNFSGAKSDSPKPQSRSLKTTPVRKQSENMESKLQKSAKLDKSLSKSMNETEVIALDTDSDEVIFMLDREPVTVISEKIVLGSPTRKVVASPKPGFGTIKGSPAKQRNDVPNKSPGRRRKLESEDMKDSDLDVPLRLRSPTNSSMSEGDSDVFSKCLSPSRRKPRFPIKSPAAHPDVRSPKKTTPKSDLKSPGKSVSDPADSSMDMPIIQLFHTKDQSAVTCTLVGDGLMQQSPRKGLGSNDTPARTPRRGRKSFSDGDQAVERSTPASLDQGRKRSISASEMSSVVKAARQADIKASGKTSPKKSPVKGKILNIESESPSKESGANSEEIKSPKRSRAVLELDVITEGDETAVVGKQSTPLSIQRGEPVAKAPRRSSQRISESSIEGTAENLAESRETKTKTPRRKSNASSRSTRKSLGTNGGSQSSATSGNDSPNRKSTKSSPTKSIELSPKKTDAPQLPTKVTTPSKSSHVGRRATLGSGSSTPRKSPRLLHLDSPMVTRSGVSLTPTKKRRTMDSASLSSCLPEIREEEDDDETESEVIFDVPITKKLKTYTAKSRRRSSPAV